jgi:hypothetical protein
LVLGNVVSVLLWLVIDCWQGRTGHLLLPKNFLMLKRSSSERFPSLCFVTACLSVLLSGCSQAETTMIAKTDETANTQPVAATSIASWSINAGGESAKGLRSLSGADG